MSQQEPVSRLEARQDRLSAMFESVTGTTIIRERQEEQVHRYPDDDEESANAIEIYLDRTLASDGLEDAIDAPESE